MLSPDSMRRHRFALPVYRNYLLLTRLVLLWRDNFLIEKIDKSIMALTKDSLQDLYRKRAGAYDFSANLYYLIGFRETRYRKQAITELKLGSGNTVVEVGCGTGLNFKYLQRALGESGRLIGVDLTDAMLDQARDRIDKNGWQNVELVRCDAADYAFPKNINGVISSFALTLVPEFEAILERASQALDPGGRLVILDLKLPGSWPGWLINLGVLITRPFGVTRDLGERKPWAVMHKYFDRVEVKQLYGGFAYLAVGEKGGETSEKHLR